MIFLAEGCSVCVQNTDDLMYNEICCIICLVKARFVVKGIVMLIITGKSVAQGAVTGKARCRLCCRTLPVCANLEFRIVSAPLWGWSPSDFGLCCRAVNRMAMLRWMEGRIRPKPHYLASPQEVWSDRSPALTGSACHPEECKDDLCQRLFVGELPKKAVGMVWITVFCVIKNNLGNWSLPCPVHEF